MNNFTFYSPTLFAFGDGEERRTGELVRHFGGTRVLLVTGGGSVRRNGAYDAAAASLQAADLPWIELSGIQPNPRSGKVYEGIELCRQHHLDFVLPWAAAASWTPPRPSPLACPMTGTSGTSSPSERRMSLCRWAWWSLSPPPAARALTAR